MPRLLQLREEFAAVSNSCFRAKWWNKLPLNERRTMCALAGVDESDVTAARPWQSISESNKKMIANCAREWARLLTPMRYA
jgi:hypothetical protein